MALISCPECGRDISDKAVACPHCGFPLNLNANNHGNLFDVILVIYYENKLEFIKFLRATLEIDLSEAKSIADNIPSYIAKEVTMDEAEEIKNKFSTKNVEISIEPNSADRNKTLNRLKTDVIVCPRCGSTAVTTDKRGFNIWTGFLGSDKTVNRCGKCGHTWKPMAKM